MQYFTSGLIFSIKFRCIIYCTFFNHLLRKACNPNWIQIPGSQKLAVSIYTECITNKCYTCKVHDICSENDVIDSIFAARRSISSSIFLKSLFICKNSKTSRCEFNEWSMTASKLCCHSWSADLGLIYLLIFSATNWYIFTICIFVDASDVTPIFNETRNK